MFNSLLFASMLFTPLWCFAWSSCRYEAMEPWNYGTTINETQESSTGATHSKANICVAYYVLYLICDYTVLV